VRAVLAKLSEVVFVETLRAYIAHFPAEQTGWLGGARESEVGNWGNDAQESSRSRGP
jgi:hypothetical protein